MKLHNYSNMKKDKKVLEVLNVNDSLIFVWWEECDETKIHFDTWTEEQKNAWKIVSDLLVKL